MSSSDVYLNDNLIYQGNGLKEYQVCFRPDQPLICHLGLQFYSKEAENCEIAPHTTTAP